MSPEVRAAYAKWFDEQVSTNISQQSKLADLSARFNRYRAGYLRGEFNEAPKNINDLGWRKYVPE